MAASSKAHRAVGVCARDLFSNPRRKQPGIVVNDKADHCGADNSLSSDVHDAFSNTINM